MLRFTFFLFFLLLLANIVAHAPATGISHENYCKSDIARCVHRELDRTIDDPTRATLTDRDNSPITPALLPNPTPSASPIELLTNESGSDPDQAAALDSVLRIRDPFPVVNSANLLNQTSDKNTRIVIFVANLQLAPGEPSSSVVVNLIDSNNQSHNVTAEDVRSVPNFSFAQIIFRLPDNLASGRCTVRVMAHGQVSNARTVRIGPTSAPFTVTIDLVKGLITFPNKYSRWQVGGGALTNFVAYPSGWTVGGGALTNFVALPPGWTVGGGALTNFVALPPGWTTGGAPLTNFVALPSGWTIGGGAPTNFVALPPGWTTGGAPLTNFVALPPGWTVGGGALTNFVALPPGWTVGGGSLTNFVGLAAGWTTGGGSLTNFVALPPGWTTGGSSLTNFVAVPPGWVVGGGSLTNFVTYPGPTVTTITLAFNDPGFLALFQKLQAAGTYSDSDLADIIMAVHLNTQPFFLLGCGPFPDKNPTELAPAGQW